MDAGKPGTETGRFIRLKSSLTILQRLTGRNSSRFLSPRFIQGCGFAVKLLRQLKRLCRHPRCNSIPSKQKLKRRLLSYEGTRNSPLHRRKNENLSSHFVFHEFNSLVVKPQNPEPNP